MSMKEWILLILFLSISILSDSILSLQLIIYPPVAESKHASAFEYTLVFGIYSGTIALVCPFVGSLVKLTKLHPKWLFAISVFLNSLLIVTFGLLEYIQDRASFIIFSCVLQIFKGALTGVDFVSTYALIPLLFPEKFTKIILGAMEACDPLASVIGPLLGASFYHVGGFPLPFYIIGSLMAIFSGTMILLMYRRPGISSFSSDDIDSPIIEDTAKSTQLTIMDHPTILASYIIVFVAEVVLTFSDSTIEPYLRKAFGSTPIMSSLLISIPALTSVISPLIGYLNFNKSKLNCLVFIGITLELIGVLFIGPLPIQGSYALSLSSMMLLVLGYNLMIFPSFLLIMQETESLGFENNNAVFTKISGIYLTTLMVARLIASPINGALFDQFGYRNSQLFSVVLLGILMIYYSWVSAKKSCLVNKIQLFNLTVLK